MQQSAAARVAARVRANDVSKGPAAPDYADVELQIPSGFNPPHRTIAALQRGAQNMRSHQPNYRGARELADEVASRHRPTTVSPKRLLHAANGLSATHFFRGHWPFGASRITSRDD
jgi:hypothetical protein